MISEEVLKIVLNNKTFGQREAADIVEIGRAHV